MKKTWLLLLLAFAGTALFAQTADDLQKLAREQMQRTSFDSAYRTLSLALQQKPNDIDLMKDQAYVCVLKRDFTNGLVIAENLTGRADADEQSYQLAGMVYKGMAESGVADKMYKTALKKFPQSGMLYAEYGDMLLLDHKPAEAIEVWEKGIKADVNNNSNYYYAAKYYSVNGNNLLWSLLYGEIFVNIESYSQRTEEIKELLYKNYVKLLTGNTLATINAGSKGVTKALTDILIKNKSTLTGGDTIQNITAIRQNLLVEWVNSGAAKQYPFRLFDLHRQLIEAKIFTAYNEWLFGEIANETAYDKWQTAHAAEMQQWQQLLHSVVFKIPAGQYYTN